jgi:hypothetical protein
MPKIDLPSSDLVLVGKYNRYTFLYAKTDKTSAENIELASLQTELADYLITAADWNGLFTSVSDGKNAVATAITGKGVPASGGDTFTQLAGKIGSISTGTDTSDATATASDVLAPKTFYAGGKITGTLALTGNAGNTIVLPGETYYNNDAKTKRTNAMPNRAGDTAALASSISGTTLKLRASNGYRDGIDDNVTITDSNFVASKIVAPNVLFGLTGTASSIDLSPGSNLWLTANAAGVSTNSTNLSPIGQRIRFANAGTYRISFTIESNYAASVAGCLYVFGVGQIGALYTAGNGSPVDSKTYTQDLAISAGWDVYIAIRRTSGSPDYYVTCRNLQVYCVGALPLAII